MYMAEIPPPWFKSFNIKRTCVGLCSILTCSFPGLLHPQWCRNHYTGVGGDRMGQSRPLAGTPSYKQ
jgi:hypothetical protein